MRVFRFGFPIGVFVAAVLTVPAALAAAVTQPCNSLILRLAAAWCGLAIACLILAWVVGYHRAGGHLKGQAKRLAWQLAKFAKERRGQFPITLEEKARAADFFEFTRYLYFNRFHRRLRSLREGLNAHEWGKETFFEADPRGWWDPRSLDDIIYTSESLRALSMRLP